MLLLLLLVAGLAASPQAYLVCANDASVQTQPVVGPAESGAVLKVSTGDDHGKNTHLCVADYQLLITHPAASEPVVQTLLSSDGAWDRRISVRISGFSRDGKSIFGVLVESGRNTSLNMLFEYNTTNHKVSLFDLGKQSAICPRNCLPSADVVGTTEGGAGVAELTFAGHCAPSGRWLLNSSLERLESLPEGTVVVGLFGATSKASASVPRD